MVVEMRKTHSKCMPWMIIKKWEHVHTIKALKHSELFLRSISSSNSLIMTEKARKHLLSAPNRAIWLRLRFVIRIANCKSLAIWNTVNLLRKAHCSDYLCRKTALRFYRRFEQRLKPQIARFESAIWAARDSDLGEISCDLGSAISNHQRFAICDLEHLASNFLRPHPTPAVCSTQKEVDVPHFSRKVGKNPNPHRGSLMGHVWDHESVVHVLSLAIMLGCGFVVVVVTTRVIGVNLWMWLEWLANHSPTNLDSE